jgi:hypothetical protein
MYEANEAKTKVVVSISEMARMVGLSRSRFHQLIGTTFPWPLYAVSNRRPFYDEELQKCCLEVRHRNCGIDGKPVLFYSRRPVTTVHVRRPNKAKLPKDNPYDDLIDGLKGLGLATVTVADVAQAVKQLYPQGMPKAAEGEVLRAVFLHLRRQNTSDNVQK